MHLKNIFPLHNFGMSFSPFRHIVHFQWKIMYVVLVITHAMMLLLTPYTKIISYHIRIYLLTAADMVFSWSLFNSLFYILQFTLTQMQSIPFHCIRSTLSGYQPWTLFQQEFEHLFRVKFIFSGLSIPWPVDSMYYAEAQVEYCEREQHKSEWRKREYFANKI